MTTLRLIPSFDELSGISEFIGDLRTSLFKSQRAAGEFLGRDRSIISRYESSDDPLQPQVGCVAALAQRFFEIQLNQFPDQSTQDHYQYAILRQVNLAINHSYATDSPFHDWAELVRAAQDFLTKEVLSKPPASTTKSVTEARPQRLTSWSSAPDVASFQGREDEYTTLSQWIEGDGCRLVGVLGMGGVGKTLLATKVMVDVADGFDGIIWRSLRYAQPLEQLLQDLLLHLTLSLIHI